MFRCAAAVNELQRRDYSCREKCYWEKQGPKGVEHYESNENRAIRKLK